MVARMICSAHGLDPDEIVAIGDGVNDTLAESMKRTTLHSMSYTTGQWNLFRCDASKLIAAMDVVERLKMRGFCYPPVTTETL